MMRDRLTLATNYEKQNKNRSTAYTIIKLEYRLQNSLNMIHNSNTQEGINDSL